MYPIIMGLRFVFHEKFFFLNNNKIFLDRDDDCLDRSDEMHCSARQCPPHMYPCNVTGQCIDIMKVCNGQQDCSDGTDESSQCGKSIS